MEPSVEEAMYGPQWQGTFTREGYTYSLIIQDYDKEKVEQTLSSMVEYERDD